MISMRDIYKSLILITKLQFPEKLKISEMASAIKSFCKIKRNILEVYI